MDSKHLWIITEDTVCMMKSLGFSANSVTAVLWYYSLTCMCSEEILPLSLNACESDQQVSEEEIPVKGRDNYAHRCLLEIL